MSNNLKYYDANQVLRSVFDIDKNTLRVSIIDGSTGGGGGFEVIISHLNDSIRLGDGTNYFTSTTVSSKVGLDVNVIGPITIGGAPTTPTIVNPIATVANVEYSYTFPTNTKKFGIRARGNARLQIAFISGQSSTIFKTIFPGSEYNEVDVNLTTTIYYQSNKTGEILEIISWV